MLNSYTINKLNEAAKKLGKDAAIATSAKLYGKIDFMNEMAVVGKRKWTRSLVPEVIRQQKTQVLILLIWSRMRLGFWELV
jgi:hypothetical protein